MNFTFIMCTKELAFIWCINRFTIIRLWTVLIKILEVTFVKKVEIFFQKIKWPITFHRDRFKRSRQLKSWSAHQVLSEYVFTFKIQGVKFWSKMPWWYHQEKNRFFFKAFFLDTEKLSNWASFFNSVQFLMGYNMVYNLGKMGHSQPRKRPPKIDPKCSSKIFFVWNFFF